MAASWRNQYQYKGYLFVLNPDTVFAAQVNQASISYPLAQVTYDSVTTGAYTDINPGMTILFGTEAGLGDLGRGRVRKTPTSTILYIGWSSQGTRDGECNLADDAYITVLDDYRAWAKIPRLVNFEDQYKDYDLDYTAGVDIPPFANGGPWVFKLVDSSNEISVDFAGVATAVDPGSSISTHAWDFVDGTPSSAATASVNGVTFPGGQRWVRYTVTDDNGNSHTHNILVVAGTRIGSEVSYSGASYDATNEDVGHGAEDAFDDDTETNWQTEDGTTTGYIEVTFASPVTIAGYQLRNGSTMHIGKNPTEWTIQIGSGLTTVDSQTGVTWAGADETHLYILPQPFTSTVFRMDITANNGHGLNVGIAEWDLLVDSPNYITNFEVVEQTVSREGQIFRVVIHDSIAESSYPDGTAVMYMEREYYDGAEGSLAGFADREHMKFIGWHATDPAQIEASTTGILTNTEFECHDIGARMRNLPAFSSYVGRIGTSTGWYLLPSAHTDRYNHYLLHWHSTVLDVAPFTWSGTGGTYALAFFATTATNLWDQVNYRTASIGHALTVSMQGELKMIVDPQLQDSGDRTSTVITDIDPQDYSAITYTHTRPPRVYWLWSSAVVASTAYVSQAGLNLSSVFSVAPGEAPGQGGIDQTAGDKLVVDQDEENARTGHFYAGLNAPETFFEIALMHGGDVGMQPASMEWVRLTISSTQASQRGLTFTDERFLPYQLSIVHEPGGVKTVTLSAEREVVGTPAATFIPETDYVVPVVPNPDDWPIIYDDTPTYELHRGASTIAIFNDDGLMYTTTEFNIPSAGGGPTWTETDLTSLTPALSGNLLSFVGDPYSPLYADTGTTVNGWILTDTNIYLIEDVFGVSTGPTLTDQHTLANANADYGFIGTQIGAVNWVVGTVVYNDANGTIALYTTDGGSTWTEATITAHYDSGTPLGPNYTPPVFCSSTTPGLVYAGAYSSTGATPSGGLYSSTDYGATWGAASTPSVTFGNSPGGTFNIPWHDNAGQLLNYHAGFDKSGNTLSTYRTEADGTTVTDITPDTSDWGTLWGFWALAVCPTDRQRIALAGYQINPEPDQFAVWVSQDGGDNWTQSTSTVTSDQLTGLAIAGDDPNVMYAWGRLLNVQYSEDGGITWDDKGVNLSGTGRIVAMVGG